MNDLKTLQRKYLIDIRGFLSRVLNETATAPELNQIAIEINDFFDLKLKEAYTAGANGAVDYVKNEFKQNRSYDSAKSVFNVSERKMDDILESARNL